MIARLFICLLCLGILNSCKKDSPPDCFKSVGAKKTITRSVEAFHALYLNDKIDVYLHQDSSKDFRIMLTGGKNILPKIRTEVKNGTLYLEDENTCQWVRDLSNRTRLDVWIKDLDNIELHGLSTMNMEKQIRLYDTEVNFFSSADQNWNIYLNELTLNHRGVGDIVISGRAAVYIPTLYFVAGADARKMEADFAFVYSYTTAEAWVQPVKGLGVFIYDTGNVYYTREPWKHIVFEKNGPGERVYAPVY